METTAKFIQRLGTLKKTCILLVFFIAGLVLSFRVTASVVLSGAKNLSARKSDTSLSKGIKIQLSDFKSKTALYYPNSVNRFYSHNGFQPVWVKEQTNPKQTWEAMMLLDCVLQFGLSHNDYHPKELLYDRLHTILEKPGQVNNSEKAQYDIRLTDALIAFMDHLHYGKLNPEFSSEKIDAGTPDGFNADDALAAALRQGDFMRAVLDVQPKSKAYADLQYHMHLLEGVYQGDCYDIPDSTIRKMAINMERLRWANTDKRTYIQINIPSYTLSFHEPDTTFEFKVVVGRPTWPTPTLNSAITYFTTAPEWKVPRKIFIKEILPLALKDTSYLENNKYAIYDTKGNYLGSNEKTLSLVKQNPGGYYARQSSGCDNSLGLIVFRFPNVYDIYVHDTPEQQLFKKNKRDFSHGCVRVEQAEKLARLLLEQDSSAYLITKVHKAISAYKTRDFKLKKPVQTKITYLTCEMVNGVLTTYKDIYDLDKRLEMALYNVTDPLVMN